MHELTVYSCETKFRCLSTRLKLCQSSFSEYVMHGCCSFSGFGFHFFSDLKLFQVNGSVCYKQCTYLYIAEEQMWYRDASVLLHPSCYSPISLSDSLTHHLLLLDPQTIYDTHTPNVLLLPSSLSHLILSQWGFKRTLAQQWPVTCHSGSQPSHKHNVYWYNASKTTHHFSLLHLHPLSGCTFSFPPTFLSPVVSSIRRDL